MIKATCVCACFALLPVIAQAVDVGGHIALTGELDTNRGQAQDLGVDLLADDWFLGVYASGRDVSYEEWDGSTQVYTQSTGAYVSYDGSVWGSGLAYNAYDDGELVNTREWAARLSWAHKALKITTNIHRRQHDLDLELGQFQVSDAFSSLGLGLGVRWQFESDASIYASAIHYDYSKDDLLQDTLRRIVQQFIYQPEQRRRLRAAYFSVQGANAQVRGNLIADGYSTGVDYPVGEHWLSANYSLNFAEVDGSRSESFSVSWQHTLSEDWGLDVYAGLARGDQLLDSNFGGLTIHWFVIP